MTSGLFEDGPEECFFTRANVLFNFQFQNCTLSLTSSSLSLQWLKQLGINVFIICFRVSSQIRIWDLERPFILENFNSLHIIDWPELIIWGLIYRILTLFHKSNMTAACKTVYYKIIYKSKTTHKEFNEITTPQ